MDSLQLNFVPLSDQNRTRRVYRKQVLDSSQEKQDSDFRVNLPTNSGDGEWKLYDVSLVSKRGYEELEFEFALNHVLSVHVIHQELLEILERDESNIAYYVPRKAIFLRKIHFVTKEYKEGNSEIIVRPHYLKSQKLFGFLFEHKFSLNEGQPFNRVTQIRSFSLDVSGRPNIYFYKDKKSEIDRFTTNVFHPIISGTDLDIDSRFSAVPSKALDVKTYLVGNGRTARSQFMGIKSNGPYRLVDGNVRYLFLFSERTRSLARDVYLGLTGKLFPGQFPGLQKMFSLPIRKDLVEHHLVQDFDEPSIGAIESRVRELKSSFSNSKIIVVAVLPKGFKGVEAAFDAYGYLKLMALRNDTYCQVVTEDTFFKKDQLKWSVSNIGLQIFSKLGGAPWLVKPAKNNCLIFGLGSVQETLDGNITKYTAYTVCLDSSGDFRYIKPLSSSNDEPTYLDSLKSNLQEVLSSELGEHYKSLVLHLPRKISRKEIDVVKEVVSSIRKVEEFEVIVIRINTKHKYLGFSDHNTCVPYESTYVQLSTNEFLIWAEGLQYGKEVLHKRVSEPLLVEFMESREEWTTKKECLQDILNLTGANWRGFNAKAQPISISYSRLIARFMKEFSHLESVNDMSIVSAKSVAPWFL